MTQAGPGRRPKATAARRRWRLVDALERWSVFRMHRAAAALWDACEQATGSVGLTLVEFAALSVLLERPGLSQSVLGERIGLDRTSASRLTARLEDRGLVERKRRADDGRSFLVAITPSQRGLVRTAQSMLRDVEQTFFEPLFEHEREHLRLMLRALEPPQYVLGDL
jgi:DNA-binding MarR family transcriptional regulator